MLVFDTHDIGNELLSIRKKLGLTQSEVAEISGLSDRTYADIERGVKNMRVETLLKVCKTLNITPDEILTKENDTILEHQEDILQQLSKRSKKEQETAFHLLSIYLNSLD